MSVPETMKGVVCMADGHLIFDTKIDQTGFNRGTRAISNTVKRDVSGISNSLKKVAKAAAVAFSAKVIYSYAKSTKELYNTQIEAETKLSTIMRQRMAATDDQIKSIKELASEQQKLGIIGDEVQLAGAQQIATFVTQTDTIRTRRLLQSVLPTAVSAAWMTSSRVPSARNTTGTGSQRTRA